MRRRTIAGAAAGLLAGLLNGLLGAGGGTVVVPALEACGLPPRHAHASSIAVIVPLCAVSLFFYLRGGTLSLRGWWYIVPCGLAGGLLAARLLPKIPANVLRRLFGAFMLYAAWRLLCR